MLHKMLEAVCAAFETKLSDESMGATLNAVQMALYNLGVVASGCAVARAHSPIIVGALIIYVCICVCADRSK